jgi:hypothetical protein
MSINFSEAVCQTSSNHKLFGLCDDPPPPHKAAYIDETNGAKWIAVVVNDDRYNVTFTAIDHCIPINRADGKPSKRCDGVITFNTTVVFVELKAIGGKGNDWVEVAEKQLKITIGHFEAQDDADNFNQKKAYIANSEHPKFKESQTRRMNQFFVDTGYVLRVENRIILQ